MGFVSSKHLIDALVRKDLVAAARMNSGVFDTAGVISAARDSGLTVIGEGFYSLVIRNPTMPGVIKINKRPDDPWHHYARYSMDHSDNPMVPKVYELFQNESGTKAVAWMEELSRAKIETSIGMHKVVSAVGSPEFSKTYPDAKTAKKKIKDYLTKWFAIDYGGSYNDGDLARIVSWMAEVSKTGHFCSDCHPNNWMLRGDQLVLIDPLCHAQQMS
jgi:hypothetical protein